MLRAFATRDVLRQAAHALVLAVLLGTATAALSPALEGGFVFDDERSPILQDLRAGRNDPYRRFTSLGALLAGRPLTELTFVLDHERGGLEPRVYHQTNIALHLATVLLVYALGRALLRRAGLPDRPGPSLAAAMLFALHPAQSQAVCYVSQRSELLGSALSVATLLVLLSADRARRVGAAIILGFLALVLFALALAAKPIAVSVPLAFLLTAVAFPHDDAAGEPAPSSRWVRRAALMIPMVALIATQAIAFFGSLRGRDDVGFAIPGLEPWHYLLTQARVIPIYLGNLLWPANLVLDREIVPSSGLLEPPATLAGALLVLALLFGAIFAVTWTRLRGRDHPITPAVRVAAFGVLWFLLLLAPTSTVIPLADVAMDHRVYLAAWGPFAGIVALVGHAASRLEVRARTLALAAAAISAGAVLAVGLHREAQVWGSDVALWSNTALKSPTKARVHANLARARERAGDLAGAVASYERALALRPAAEHASNVRFNIATVLLRLGRAAEARAYLEEWPRRPETWALLATIELSEGRIEAAAMAAEAAVQGAPESPGSWAALAKVRLARGDQAGARDAARNAARLAGK